MSGTLCGILDSFYNTGPFSWQREQTAFKILFEFFERMVAVGNAERIALQYGSGGTGTDYWDESNPFGENAFFVYKLLASASTERTVDLYVMGQWAYTDNFGNSPGNPGSSYSDNSNALCMAFREDGTSPWAGTTNNDGTDTKGTPVWTAGGSTLHVMDRSCSDIIPTGTWNTDKERMLHIGDFYTGTNRHIILGDADSILYLSQPSGADDWTVSYFGIYVPRIGLTPDYPFVAMASGSALTTVFYEDGYGSHVTTAYGGGIIGTRVNDVCQIKVRFLTDYLTFTGMQPNNQISPAELDEFPIYLHDMEYHSGLCGYLPTDLVASVGLANQNDTNGVATRAYVGYNNSTSIKLSIPWDGGAAPGTSSTRGGRVW